ncbi:MAG: SDR family NAD(P)-dependent oxidoreductase [Propionibacteriales bacterium]|nr:SDR family NAD(P)-dependent oxidoreductase [Propionibacteriales bacterium]
MNSRTGQVVLVTGATDGLGRYLTGELTAGGASVVAHGRNPSKLGRLRDDLGVETVRADLARLRDVDAMADELLERVPRLDVLVNNAGVGFGPPGGERELSGDGIELRLAVNYLAGYRLTRRLLPLLVESAPARIVNVSSIGQQPLDFDDPMLEASYDGITAYRRSKLAQVMFTLDLAHELRDRGVTVNALHPATFMNTSMVFEHGAAPMSTVEEGGAATLRLVTDEALAAVTGRFFDGRREARPDRTAYDEQARARLRRLSDELVTSTLRSA